MDKERTELQKEFPGLIQDTKERLSQEPGEHYLIFNNVGNWPVGAAAAAPVDAAVSYTHLDVYKRQRISSWSFWMTDVIVIATGVRLAAQQCLIVFSARG